jgi:hypothetical protein
MKKTVVSSSVFALALLLSILVVATSQCKDRNETKVKQNLTTSKADTLIMKEPENRKEAMNNVQSGVDSISRKDIQEKRNEVIIEAKSAIQETDSALIALDNKKPKEALAALARATGKLEIILARDPKLALAPLEINVTTHDMAMSLESIKKLRYEAQRLIKDGEIQKARQIIGNLGSEVVISQVNIPLATYPDAIKTISPLIDKGKIEEAKTALSRALNTLVITDNIIPLPVVRAEKMLKEAEAISENVNRTTKDNDTLSLLIENARYQLEMADALGYGEKKDYANMYDQLKEVEKKTEKGKSGKGFFTDIKNSLTDMRKKVFK